MYCIKCGKKIVPKAKFCLHCGRKLRTGAKDVKKIEPSPKITKFQIKKRVPIWKQIKLSEKNRYFLYLSLLFFVFSAIVFIYQSIFKYSDCAEQNTSSCYYQNIISFNEANPVFIILAILLFLAISSYFFNVRKLSFMVEDIIFGFSIAFFSIFVGSIISIYSLYPFAYSQAYALNNKIIDKPETLKIIWGDKNLADELEYRETTPKILTIEEGDLNQQVYKSILIDGKDNGSFFDNRVMNWTIFRYSPLKNIPDKEPIVLFRDRLLIRKFDKDSLEKISPILVKLMISEGLENHKYIKNNPDIRLIGRQEYLGIRERNINRAVQDLDNQISYYQDQIDQTNANIEIINSNISVYEEAIKIADDKEDDQAKASLEEKLNYWQNELANYSSSLSELTRSFDTLNLSRILTESSKSTTPNELGVFEPDNTIEIALDTTDKKSVDNYIQTLIHEYLHYTSYVSEERTLPGFFEEGMTSYFADEVVKKTSDGEPVTGYPVITSVIEEMAKKIPADKFQDIYLNKDGGLLTNSLDESYGTNFYENNKYYFDLAYYHSSGGSFNSAVDYSNRLLAAMGNDNQLAIESTSEGVKVSKKPNPEGKQSQLSKISLENDFTDAINNRISGNCNEFAEYVSSTDQENKNKWKERCLKEKNGEEPGIVEMFIKSIEIASSLGYINVEIDRAKDKDGNEKKYDFNYSLRQENGKWKITNQAE